MDINIHLTTVEVIITSVAPPLIFATYHIIKAYLRKNSNGTLQDVETKKK